MNDQTTAGGAKRSFRLSFLVFLIIFAIGTIQALTGNSGSVTAQVDDTSLGVLGLYGDAVFVPLSDIIDVQFLDSLDFGTCIDGEKTPKIISGIYSNQVYGEYILHVYYDSSPYIAVSYGEGQSLVFNLQNAKLTKDVYQDLIDAASN